MQINTILRMGSLLYELSLPYTAYSIANLYRRVEWRVDSSMQIHMFQILRDSGAEVTSSSLHGSLYTQDHPCRLFNVG